MKKNTLDELRQKVIEQNICVELKNFAAHLVFGDGDPDSEIVLIGEAPGKKEDETGMPFVGASGKFLDEMLGGAGLSREQVYITNIVKYRPPDNRDPSREEKAEFWPILLEQLRIIRPKLVITLGRHSGHCFEPSLVISRDHGKIWRKKYDDLEFDLATLYHPAAALYRGAMRQILISDFIKVVNH